MSFELLEPTPARLEDIEVLSQKNRQPDEAPGVKLHLSVTVPNHALSTIDGRLKGWLYEKNEGKSPAPLVTKRKDNQSGELEGVEPVSDLPSLTRMGKMLKSIVVHEEFSGYSAEIRFATTVLPLEDCIIPSGMKITLKDGGSIIAKFCLEIANASESMFAKLAKYKSREIEIMVAQHPVSDDKQKRIDTDPNEPPATTPPKAPTKGSVADHADEVIKAVKSASDKAEGNAPAEDNSPPPQRLTHENVPDEKPADEKPRGRRRVVAGVE